MATNKVRKTDSPDANPDPITGAPGAHPVGVGIGAAGGGLVGAAAGAIAGPVGAAVGAAVGAVAGGLGGKAAAETMDPTVEDAYWRENYRGRPYVVEGVGYDEYQPAYRYGWESRARYPERRFEEVEVDLEREWGRTDNPRQMSWESARPPVRDAWDRLSPRGT